MNFQFLLLNDKKTDNAKLNGYLDKVAEEIKSTKIKLSDKKVMLGDMGYYHNCLPIIPESRDLLKKASNICPIRVNWKKEAFEGLTSNEIYSLLKPQYGFCISIVDKDYTRNNYKNREFAWIVFDSEKSAEKNMRLFNKMFRTAIEQNAIDEYKRFKQNPMKRPLTYDKLVDNAYELYDMVDRGEI